LEVARVARQQETGLTVAAILTAAPNQEAEAREPETSVSERRLHGDLAGIVKLLREASSAAEDAYALACRHRKALPAPKDPIGRVRADALDQAVEQTWKAKAQTRLAFLDAASIPPQLFRK
jgi:hypothetical protein